MAWHGMAYRHRNDTGYGIRPRRAVSTRRCVRGLRAAASTHARSRRFFPPFLSTLPSRPCRALPFPCASPASFAPSLTVCLSYYCVRISRFILSRTIARVRLPAFSEEDSMYFISNAREPRPIHRTCHLYHSRRAVGTCPIRTM